jgi:hypothetical protein
LAEAHCPVRAEPAWLVEPMTRSEVFRRAFPDGSAMSNQRTDPAIPRVDAAGLNKLEFVAHWGGHRSIASLSSRSKRYSSRFSPLRLAFGEFADPGHLGAGMLVARSRAA